MRLLPYLFMLVMLFAGLVIPYSMDVPSFPTKFINSINISTQEIKSGNIFQNKSGTFQDLCYYVEIKQNIGTGISLSPSAITTQKASSISKLMSFPIISVQNYTAYWEEIKQTCADDANESTCTNETLKYSEPRTTIEYGSAPAKFQTGKNLVCYTDIWQRNNWTIGIDSYLAEPLQTGCGVLSTAGATYDLTGDIWGISNTCMNVSAAGVVLDCGGHWINGTNATNQIGVNVSADDFRMVNCNIANFSTAVNVSAKNVWLVNSTLNTTHDYNVFATIGATGLNVSNVSVYADGTAHGIYNTAAKNVSIDCQGANMTGVKITQYGVWTQGDNTSIKNCVGGGWQITFYLGGGNATVSGNNLTSLSSEWFINGQNISQLITMNNFVGLTTNARSFVSSNTYNDSNFTFNNVNSSLGYAIAPSGNRLIFDSNNITCSGSTNCFYTGTVNYMNVSNNIITTSQTSSTYRAIQVIGAARYSIFANNTITARRGARAIYTSDSRQNNFTNNTIKGNSSGIYISGSFDVNNTIDCQGAYINGTGASGLLYGLYLSGTNNTAKNCNVWNFSYGAYTNTNGNFFLNNTIQNSTNGRGIIVDAQGGNNTIIGNFVNASSFSLGIAIYGARNTTIANNIVLMDNADRRYAALYLGASSSKNCSNNNITNNTFNITKTDAIAAMPIMVAAGVNNSITNNTLWTESTGTTIPAINITAVSGNNTFLYNNITSNVWIDDENETDAGTNITTNIFNSSNAGNIYYWTNGTGAWQVFDISCTGTAPCFADAGTSRPFNFTTVSSNFSGAGQPQDWFPYTENGGGATTCTPPINPCTNWTISLADNCNIYNWSQDMTQGGTCNAGINYTNVGSVRFWNVSVNWSFFQRGDSSHGQTIIEFHANGGVCLLQRINS